MVNAKIEERMFNVRSLTRVYVRELAYVKRVFCKP